MVRYVTCIRKVLFCSALSHAYDCQAVAVGIAWNHTKYLLYANICLPLHPILSQLNQVFTFTPHLYSIIVISFHLCLGLASELFHFQDVVCISHLYACYVPHPSQWTGLQCLFCREKMLVLGMQRYFYFNEKNEPSKQLNVMLNFRCESH
jgi:hypothetical protein